jgi:hypothetical protein
MIDMVRPAAGMVTESSGMSPPGLGMTHRARP